jgi:hypothetical protein
LEADFLKAGLHGDLPIDEQPSRVNNPGVQANSTQTPPPDLE